MQIKGNGEHWTLGLFLGNLKEYQGATLKFYHLFIFSEKAEKASFFFMPQHGQ